LLSSSLLRVRRATNTVPRLRGRERDEKRRRPPRRVFTSFRSFARRERDVFTYSFTTDRIAEHVFRLFTRERRPSAKMLRSDCWKRTNTIRQRTIFEHQFEKTNITTIAHVTYAVYFINYIKIYPNRDSRCCRR